MPSKMNCLMGKAVVAGLAIALSGCTSIGGKQADAEAAQPPAQSSGWRAVATDNDKNRIRNWYTAWKEALASANAGGYAMQVSQESDLLNPDAALPNPYLPPGDYRCRTVKVGAKGSGGLPFVGYPWFVCRVTAEQNIFSLTKTTGSQRTTGLVFEDNDRRQIFLGTLILGDESGPRDYGTDQARDMAGIVERIGDKRWRVVFPYPAYESLVDVMEIAP